MGLSSCDEVNWETIVGLLTSERAVDTLLWQVFSGFSDRTIPDLMGLMSYSNRRISTRSCAGAGECCCPRIHDPPSCVLCAHAAGESSAPRGQRAHARGSRRSSCEWCRGDPSKHQRGTLPPACRLPETLLVPEAFIGRVLNPCQRAILQPPPTPGCGIHGTVAAPSVIQLQASHWAYVPDKYTPQTQQTHTSGAMDGVVEERGCLEAFCSVSL